MSDMKPTDDELIQDLRDCIGQPYTHELNLRVERRLWLWNDTATKLLERKPEEPAK